MIKKEELEKLRPEERIKKLKGILEQKRKEFTEIERLINKSVQEIKTEKIAADVAPEPRTVDISHLFEPIGNQLERTVEEGKPAEGEGGHGYVAFAQQYSDYYSLKKILPYAASGSLNEEQLQMIDRIGERLQRIKYKVSAKEIEDIVTASKAALNKIRRYAGIE